MIGVPFTSVAQGDATTIREISFRVWHEPDGMKYPNQVKESYTLDKGGTLHYWAYFGGVPINFNHNDSVDWQAGAAGQTVLATALHMLGDKPAGLDVLPDHEATPEGGPQGVYFVRVTRNDADSTFIIKDPRSQAWGQIGAAFTAMVAAFQQQTGRPLTPSMLR